MTKLTLEERKEQNNRSAQAIAFLLAGIIASLVWGFLQDSLPAFLLAAVFGFNLFLETREYRRSYNMELEAAKYNEENIS